VSTASDWSAGRYSAFERERTRPARDLLAAVPSAHPHAVVDVGCGPGNSTQLLVERFPGTVVTAFDSSADMINAARKRLPQVRFEQLTIEAWSEPGPFDLIFANAVLQWIPDHATLLPALAAKLAPGGSLAIQMPDNLEEPAHRLMREVAADSRWAHKLAEASESRSTLPSADWYYRLLRGSCSEVQVWRTTYYHTLAGPAAVVEWFRGTGLRPFLDPLDESGRTAYLAQYTSAIADTYPVLPDGTLLLPFPRLFLVATR
jgi:trans-aconitate 2-methyltransferase